MSKQRKIQKTKNGNLFDPAAFFETTAKGRTISTHRNKEIIFSQGDASDAVFYIKKGNVKVCVISNDGKEAVVAILGHGRIPGRGMLDRTAQTACDSYGNDGMRDNASGKDGDHAVLRTAHILKNVSVSCLGKERTGQTWSISFSIQRRSGLPGCCC